MKIRNQIVATMLAVCVASSIVPATTFASTGTTTITENGETSEKVKPTKNPESGETSEKVKPTKNPENGETSEKVKPTKNPEKEETKEETDKESTDKKETSKKMKIKVTSKGSSSIKINWDKVEDADYYEVYRATSKNGKYKKVKTVTSSSKNTYVNENLKTGKKYYYKIRTYKKVNGKKVYGEYSAVKTTTVK
ncbi:MAG: fibronectin type III domain-containing protein [Lachnospiraceae bacterium]|nr:fibronectin type III domain-containing protein [Lachnospiraceae bacterium]